MTCVADLGGTSEPDLELDNLIKVCKMWVRNWLGEKFKNTLKWAKKYLINNKKIFEGQDGVG